MLMEVLAVVGGIAVAKCILGTRVRFRQEDNEADNAQLFTLHPREDRVFRYGGPGERLTIRTECSAPIRIGFMRREEFEKYKADKPFKAWGWRLREKDSIEAETPEALYVVAFNPTGADVAVWFKPGA